MSVPNDPSTPPPVTSAPNLGDSPDKDPARVTAEQVRADLNTLIKDAQALLSDTTKDTFDKHAGEVSSAMNEKISQLRQEYEDKRELAMRYERDLEAKIRERPLTSIGIAFAAGVVIASLSGCGR